MTTDPEEQTTQKNRISMVFPAVIAFVAVVALSGLVAITWVTDQQLWSPLVTGFAVCWGVLVGTTSLVAMWQKRGVTA